MGSLFEGGLIFKFLRLWRQMIRIWISTYCYDPINKRLPMSNKADRIIFICSFIFFYCSLTRICNIKPRFDISASINQATVLQTFYFIDIKNLEGNETALAPGTVKLSRFSITCLASTIPTGFPSFEWNWLAKQRGQELRKWFSEVIYDDSKEVICESNSLSTNQRPAFGSRDDSQPI